MNELEKLLKDRIEKTGPLSLHDYMETALSHPQYGYYARQEPFGEEGDFITAPEISQAFGELVGLWCVDCWTKLGGPAAFNLVEFGPGNGTLMADALRSAALVPEFLTALDLHLVENSTRLRSRQEARLKPSGITATWHTGFPGLPKRPTLFVANEFFDALPIHQYVRQDGQWFERLVDWQDQGLRFRLDDKAATLEETPAEMADGTVLETCPGAAAFMTEISRTLHRDGGAALIIDYGASDSLTGDSFQALRGHRYSNPLQDPGTADLTAHVKFRQLKEIAEAEGLTCQGPTSQGRFLERLGIEARLEMLARKANEAQRKTLKTALRRLTSTEEMGTLFKVLAVSHSMSALPEGFGN